MFGILKNLFSNGSDGRLREILKEGAFLVDVRSPGEFASGSVKGAVNIPLDTVSSQLATFRNKKNIVVFCRSGMRSSQAQTILQRNGFTNVFNGGTWQNVATAANT